MLILSLLSLAVLDALNPFSIVTMALLLATNRPIARGWVFIAGTLAVYLSFGIMLVEGWTAVLASLVPLLPQWAIGAALFLAGLGCLAFALHSYRQDLTQDQGSSFDNVLTLPATALFAVVSTVSDAPTALPYFTAAALILDMADARLEQYLWVALYCLIYISPLCVMLGIRIAQGDRAAVILSAIQRRLAWSFRYILSPVLAAFGIWLSWLAATKLLALI